jgi:phosphatidylserine/phosphatidylglycerophosphate/cardiolipin synthase-like enzyme
MLASRRGREIGAEIAASHNFMPNKFAVIDDTVITGSFNFSTNAQCNAENVLLIRSKEIADAYAA